MGDAPSFGAAGRVGVPRGFAGDVGARWGFTPGLRLRGCPERLGYPLRLLGTEASVQTSRCRALGRWVGSNPPCVAAPSLCGPAALGQGWRLGPSCPFHLSAPSSSMRGADKDSGRDGRAVCPQWSQSVLWGTSGPSPSLVDGLASSTAPPARLPHPVPPGCRVSQAALRGDPVASPWGAGRPLPRAGSTRMGFPHKQDMAGLLLLPGKQRWGCEWECARGRFSPGSHCCGGAAGVVPCPAESAERR